MFPATTEKDEFKGLKRSKENKSNPVRKKPLSNRIKRISSKIPPKQNKNLTENIQLEEIINEKKYVKYNDIFNKFNQFTEGQLYELYNKLYKKTDNELNGLSYKNALKYDNRTFSEFYFSLIKSNHLLFFSFYPRFDFNLRIIKIYLFFFNFTTYFFVNALFFTDNTMDKINQDGGSFNFIYNLPQIFYSSIISAIINKVIAILTLTENSFISYRNNAKKMNISRLASEIIQNIKIRFAIFYILNLILLGLYWIYLSCFSYVYANTQIHLIKDTLISFGTSFISPFFIYLLPGMFRIPSLRNNKRKILYGINQILQML